MSIISGLCPIGAVVMPVHVANSYEAAGNQFLAHAVRFEWLPYPPTSPFGFGVGAIFGCLVEVRGA